MTKERTRLSLLTLGSAFAFWLFGQIADSSVFEQLWNQAAILTLGAGAIRVLIPENTNRKATDATR